MSIPYSVVARGNPQNPQVARKYYAQAQSTGQLTLRDIAEQAAEISTLSPIDMVAAIEALIIIISTALADGNTIVLGDLGWFSLSIRSEGADTEKEFTSRNIISVMIRFHPGKRLKHVLEQADYKKL
jgi:predicted histone-like DNA-binding protein